MEPPPPPKLTSLPPSSLIALHLRRKHHGQQGAAATGQGELLHQRQGFEGQLKPGRGGEARGRGNAMHGISHGYAQQQEQGLQQQQQQKQQQQQQQQQQGPRHRPESTPRRSAKRDADEHMDTLPEGMALSHMSTHHHPWRRATSNPMAYHPAFSDPALNNSSDNNDDLSLDGEQPCKLRSPYRPNRDHVYARTLELLRRGAQAVQRDAPSHSHHEVPIGSRQFSDSSSAQTSASTTPMETGSHQPLVTNFAFPRPTQGRTHTRQQHHRHLQPQQPQPQQLQPQQLQPQQLQPPQELPQPLQRQPQSQQHRHQPSLRQLLHNHPAQPGTLHEESMMRSDPNGNGDDHEGEAEEGIVCRVCQHSHPVSRTHGCAFCDGPGCLGCTHSCAGCGYSFCSLCCVANFDEQQDRYFCLSCLQQGR